MKLRWHKRDHWQCGYQAYSPGLRYRLNVVRHDDGDWHWTLWRTSTRGQLTDVAAGRCRYAREAKAMAESALLVVGRAIGKRKRRAA